MVVKNDSNDGDGIDDYNENGNGDDNNTDDNDNRICADMFTILTNKVKQFLV